jgi:hypothetical protein
VAQVAIWVLDKGYDLPLATGELAREFVGGLGSIHR